MLLTDGKNRFSAVTVDGTDFRINEPTDFSTKWFSHKFKGPGLRYEVAISKRGDIIHIQGPYPCGKWPDIKNARGRARRLEARTGCEVYAHQYILERFPLPPVPDQNQT
jgi:hypothetical protein